MSQGRIRRLAIPAALSLCAVAAAAAADAIESGPIWVPDELIVGWCHTVDTTLVDLQRQDPRIKSWRSLRHAALARGLAANPHPLSCVRVVRLRPGSDVAAAAANIRGLPGVAFAHPNYLLQPAYDPDDTWFASDQYAPIIVGAPQAWDTSFGRSEVLVAVIDSGLRMDHEDLQDGAVWFNDDPVNGLDDDRNGFIDDLHGWDFINRDSRPDDTSGHGTHVAGIIAARSDNGLGIAGLSRATLMPLKVFEGFHGTWEALAEAIFYAVDNGADVINFSGGGFGGDGLLQRAVNYAWRNNVTLVTAAGNHGSPLPLYPAAYPETIAVAATGPDDVYFPSSAFGPHIDVAAPGVDILSTYAAGPSDYRYATGTSMAAAHVTGIVALMLSRNPDLDVEQIRALLRAGAVDLGAPGFDDFFGAGRVDAAATLAAVPADTIAPFVVHDHGRTTRPFSGYIDPRAESTDGHTPNLGLDSLVITFSEPVRDADAGDHGRLTAAAFTVTASGGTPPRVESIDATGNPTVHLHLSQPIRPGRWTTVIAHVEDLSGNRIESAGDLGADIDEPDRIDLGFLPADIDQNGVVNPFDLLRLKHIILGYIDFEIGQDVDHADMDRDGSIEPIDLLRFRRIIRGVSPATRPWAGDRLTDRP